MHGKGQTLNWNNWAYLHQLQWSYADPRKLQVGLWVKQVVLLVFIRLTGQMQIAQS